jgi:hypothetical protein
MNSAYKYILIAVSIVMLLVLLVNLKQSNIVEGLSNPSHTEFISKGLKNDLASLQDSLHISKYQSNYQEIVKDMMEWCDLEILKTLVTNKINIQDGVNTENSQLISSLNQYAEFKNTLQGVYDSILSSSSAPSSSRFNIFN